MRATSAFTSVSAFIRAPARWSTTASWSSSAAASTTRICPAKRQAPSPGASPRIVCARLVGPVLIEMTGSDARLMARRHTAAVAARLGAHPLHFRRHALHQPCAGARQHRHDAGGAAVALDRDAFLARHHRAAGGAAHARLAGPLQASRARHAAAAALGAGADPARHFDPLPAAAAHRQHAHRARLLQRERHLRLRAGAPVAGERDPAKPAARHRLGARLHGHSFLAAPLSAVPPRVSRFC